MTTVWTGQREAALCQYEVMSDAMDPEPLRQLVGGVIATLGDYYTHDKLAGVCRRLGLPEPPGQEGNSNRQRVQRSFAELADTALPGVAERLLAGGEPPEPDAATRNAIQDVLWAWSGAVEIPRKTRREIARGLDLGDLAFSADRFMALLDRLWVLGVGDLVIPQF